MSVEDPKFEMGKVNAQTETMNTDAETEAERGSQQSSASTSTRGRIHEFLVAIKSLLKVAESPSSDSPDELKSIHEQRVLTLETEPENLQRELQMYMNAVNAILVGASVIASVTFSGLLESPQDNPRFILHFCIYSSLSFYSAVATVIIGAGATLPSWQSGNITTQREVERVRIWVRATSVLFAFSITCVLGAIPQPNYGNPPKVARHKELTIVRNFGLFLCSAAMTAYVLRLNWKLVLILLGLNLNVPPTERPAGMRARMSAAVEKLSQHRIARLIFVCALIYFIFLAVLFYLPFYANMKDEWKPAPPAPPNG